MNIKNSEIFLYKKEPIRLFRLSIILILILVIIFISLYTIRYKEFYSNKGIVINDNGYYLKISVLLDDLNIILNNKNLYIDNIKYKYKVISISNDTLIDNNLNSFKEIFLSVDIPDNELINNNILNFKIEKSSKKIIDYMQKYL